MTLRKKLLIASISIISIFMLMIVLLVGIITSRIHHIYEQEQVTTQVNQTRNLLNNELKSLDRLNLDYAAWDDTFSFIENKNDLYIQSNLTSETFLQNNIDHMVFINNRGKIVLVRQIDAEGKLNENYIDSNWLDRYKLKKVLHTNEKINGLIKTPEGIMLLSARPILNSQYEGPSNGTLIFTRKLDQELVSELGNIIELDLSFFQDAPKKLSKQEMEQLENENLYIDEVSDTTIAGYSVLTDLKGDPLSYIEVKSERTIYKNGRMLILLNLLSFLALVTIICTVLYFTFDKIFVSRILSLKQSIANIRSYNNNGNSVGSHGDDEIGHLAMQINDMLTTLEKYNNKWKKRANFDSLTNLPNRGYLTKKMNDLISAEEEFAVFFMDLDGFKEVNDSYGHETGDSLLQLVAERLKHIVREGDTVSRLGGDEFVLLVNMKRDEDQLRILADRVIKKLNEPYKINKIVITVSASIGIAQSPKHGTDYHSLIKMADEAMYIAKKAGKNNFHLLS
ncbi:sensor domain-containing diguanylate cyclase [Metabacillus litoralis]|uniref:sensor domain-containing diguanylate cyclase n=1 Tax=Metabacillus litoralis TaxID=152268 RepID=UPI00203ED049|nr:diguanylate cyclase [Metabacillus litoralis]MCM3411310.1 diguanylate cyclase [Metabacillus litoralis]